MVDRSVRLEGCNLGNVSGACADLNELQRRNSPGEPILRFSVIAQLPAQLDVKMIEEQNFAPLRWQTVSFFPGSQTLVPDIPASCRRAQLLAFCRSYLTRFPIRES